MKNPILFCAFFILSFSNLQAQSYQMGFGARFGKFNNGVTFKDFLQSDQNISIEAQLYSSLIAGTYGYTGKAFLEDQITFHIPFIELPMDFVFGGGFQGGYFPYNPPAYGYYKIVNGNPDYYRRNVFTAGIAANIGLEYKLKKLPFTVGIDVVPAYEFYHSGADEGFDFGVDLRYVIR